jgi:type I restriction enzyme S subunit
MSSELSTTSDYTIRPLGDVFDIVKERSDASLPIYSVTLRDGMQRRDGLGRVIQSDLESEDNLFAAKNDICYNMMRMWQGASGLAPEDCHVSPAYVVCRPKEGLDPRFAAYLLKSEQALKQFIDRSQGVTSDRWRLYPEEFIKIRLTIPPLPEQKKIAEILSGIDRLILLIQNKIKKLKTTQDGLANSWEKHVHLEPVEGSLGDLIASIDSGWSPACEDVPPKPGEWGVLKVSAVTKGYFCQEESKRLPSDLDARDQLLIRKGDLLITRANGNLDLVGRGVIVNDNPASKLLLSDKILRLNPVSNANRNFLLMLLNSRHVRRQIETAVGGSTGAKNIGQALLRQILISIPTSEDQAKIGNLSFSIYAALATSKERLDYLISLKKGLSADLLSGRKRVTL